jgi:GNAT superfamily N-acetyltransferase
VHGPVIPLRETIRRASVADAAGVLRCLRLAFEPYRLSYTAAAFADTVLGPETIASRLRIAKLFVAVLEGKEVVGTIGCHKVSAEEGHLRGMAVVPEWQGSGVAERLLLRAERELRDAGCSFISLDTTEPLMRAIRFYEKHGFRASGKVVDFFGMPLYEYVKRLTGQAEGQFPATS